MYKLIRECRMPKWLKVIVNILLTITCIYWIGWILYKFLDVVRIVVHTISEKEHWWFFVVVVIGVTITILIFLETMTDIKPFTTIWNNITNIFHKE